MKVSTTRGKEKIKKKKKYSLFTFCVFFILNLLFRNVNDTICLSATVVFFVSLFQLCTTEVVVIIITAEIHLIL